MTLCVILLLLTIFISMHCGCDSHDSWIVGFGWIDRKVDKQIMAVDIQMNREIDSSGQTARKVDIQINRLLGKKKAISLTHLQTGVNCCLSKNRVFLILFNPLNQNFCTVIAVYFPGSNPQRGEFITNQMQFFTISQPKASGPIPEF